MIIKLTEMQAGEKGIISEIRGGRCFSAKLENMGLRKHKKIRKICSILLSGPQLVQIDDMKIAVGHGMAERIYVEVPG